MRETDIVRSIISFFKESGGDAYHVHGSLVQRSGEPDIDGWITIDGLFIHCKLEVKTETGKPTPLQLYRLVNYYKAGYCAGVVTSVEETQALIHAYYTGGNDDKYLNDWLDEDLKCLMKQ